MNNAKRNERRCSALGAVLDISFWAWRLLKRWQRFEDASMTSAMQHKTERNIVESRGQF